MKKIVVESLLYSEKTAILEEDILNELLIEDKTKNKTVANIYRGVVKNVLPGMQACFVDIGFEKLGYLPMSKDEGIKSGQDILVQINKEEIGTKGAKLNTEVSIAGRYLVYIPSNDRITISNKIIDEKERFRLKKIIKNIVSDDCGVIIRTEAVGCEKEELEKDLQELVEKYEYILKEYKLGIGPKLLYKELDFAMKYIKDNISEEYDKIVVNDTNKYEEIRNLVKYINKDYVTKVILEENEDVFDLYKVQSQIDKALHKKVWLKSGGYLIIERTEALTVIDINTGKFTGNIKLDETVYKTNLEACKEIARQLRLRDIGGIIIIDFIDMNKKRYKDEVLKLLQIELKKDKRKSEVLGMTKLGLVEVVRRREKEPIDSYYKMNCPSCNVDASTKSIQSIIDDIEKEVMRINKHTSYNNITIELNGQIYKVISENNNYTIDDICKKYNVSIQLKQNEQKSYQKMNIIYNS